MNSLNILSARVSPSSSPVPSRANSLNHLGVVSASGKGDDQSQERAPGSNGPISSEPEEYSSDRANASNYDTGVDETSPLLGKAEKEANIRVSTWHTLPKRFAVGFINSLRWVLSAIATPGVYLLACLYDADGNFSPLRHLRRLFGSHGDGVKRLTPDFQDGATRNDEKRRGTLGAYRDNEFHAMRPAPSEVSSAVSSESESDFGGREGQKSSSRHMRSKSALEEIAPARRSIRIKLHNEDALRQRKHRKAQSMSAKSTNEMSSDDVSAQLKSPTSPVSALTKYPRTPAPPRPLIPRRQPSYIPDEPRDPKQLKTLILDLDETLIHSMSKGGRIGSGKMIEVRLNTTYIGSGGQQSAGPQHPILYFVHKRPHCDEFLRKACKWFNLVVFTASVQEYADPVIDWLESERKFFTGRYYRQHCTFRHGAFIKDLSSVEPDLSKVMILDNSPLSYMFHQDNAIPIQGWINDPTDNDLLHLIPLLEGLQYVSDVRALLALRGGEDGQHMMT